MKHELYRSTVPGNEMTPLVAGKLNHEEKTLQAHILELRKVVKAGIEADREIDKLIDSCKHHIFYDVAGFPYDVRHCGVCGTSMGCL